MPIYFDSNVHMNKDKGFHWKFLHQPTIQNIQSFFSSIHESVPNSYKMQFPGSIKNKKEQWSQPCSPEYQLIYLPQSILYVCYMSLEATRCQVNPPSLYTQISECLKLFFQVVPDIETHPIYIHMPGLIENDAMIIQTIWNTILDQIMNVEDVNWNPSSYFKRMELHMVHSSFAKKEVVQEQIMYGQLATARKEADHLISLSANMKPTTWLAKYYKDGCSKKKMKTNGWYFPSYCSSSVPSIKIYGHTSVKVMDEIQMKKEGLRLILAINQGNHDPARMVLFDYTPIKKVHKKPYMIVGKGVVFDSGGMNLKRSQSSILDFGKMDMTGSAVVYALMKCLPYIPNMDPIVGLCPIVENNIDGRSIHPGDRVLSHAGIPVIINNTDAEGRVIMSDAISYGLGKYHPKACIDIATLTGQAADVMNLSGSICIGRNLSSLSTMLDTLQKVREPMMQMPFFDAYISHMRTNDGAAMITKFDDSSDIYQSVGYLAQFVPPTMPWLHMDIGQSTGTTKAIGFLALLETLKKGFEKK
jgi:Cytosol aminopeptidase family, catalytic domain